MNREVFVFFVEDALCPPAYMGTSVKLGTQFFDDVVQFFQ